MAIAKILLYYGITPISDPEAIRLWQRELANSLGLRGRIIVSHQGINGTVGGDLDAVKLYRRRTREYQAFADIDFKWSEGTGLDEHGYSLDFPRLSVKVRPELVSFGVPEAVHVGDRGVVGGGKHLSPEEVNALVAERGDEVAFFDGRNAWEARLGKFKDAVVPPVGTSHDFAAQISGGKFDHLKDRPVITYCTGGVRCEFLSAMLLQQGFKEVYQIDGGIVRYGEKYGNNGLWEGSLAVFDGRELVDFGPDVKTISTCDSCGQPTSLLANCGDDTCVRRFICCPQCQQVKCPDHGLTKVRRAGEPSIADGAAASTGEPQ
ncbi:MAG: rhodanese-related sulfurtransferase [Actinomycetaceae bacterium]|nr:rhodanese-related sulfurtransferase [Actinomycetaceae bacterium]